MNLENTEITKINYYSNSVQICTSNESKQILYESITAIDNGEIENDSDLGSLGTVLGSLVGLATGDITGVIGGGVGGWLISKFVPNKKTKYLTISLADEEYFSFLSEQAERHSKNIEDKFNEYLIISVQEIKDKAATFNQRLEALKQEKDRYISYSQIYGDDNKDQSVSLSKYKLQNKILSTKSKDLLREIRHNFKSVELERKKHNEEFIAKNLDNPYLSKLIPSQKRAVLIDEDNTRINAGAGSGKTTTLIAKIAFLLDKKLCQPEELLVLAYNKDVREELIKIIKSLEKKRNFEELNKLYDNNIHTFHSYGLKQLEGKGVLKILDQVSSFEDEIIIKRSEEIDKMIGLLNKEDDFRKNLLNFLSHYFISYKDYFEDISTYEDYIKYIRNITQRSLKGDWMRSFEEVEIANYLYLSGINYEYEAEYKGSYENDESFALNDLKAKNVQTNKEKAKKSYHPDFYLPEYEIYIEHFALDESNNAPSYFKDPIKYAEQYEEKVEVHKRNKTKLIRTFSWMKKNGTLIKELEESLIYHKVKYNPLKDEEKIKKFIDGKYVSNLNQLIATFMHHVKSNELNLEDIRKKIFTINEPINQNRAALFIDIFEKIYDLYQSKLQEQDQVDFDDMIVLSRDKIKNENFKYVLVDEFQDISQARAKLLKKIKEENNCKLYCVGDDWQAIYKFVGGDISIFTKNFEKYFGYFESEDIDTTFRYGENINKVSSQFIQKNPDQLTKVVMPLSNKSKGEICIYDVANFEEILSKYASNNSKIYILGRYKKQNYKTFEMGNAVTKEQVDRVTDKYEKVEYKTIHRSKGLEADHIFIINLFVGTMGFPTQKEDDEILNIVHTNIEPISEERRLMYVALTRAKKSVHLFSGSEWACSDFVKEIVEDYPDNIKSFLKKSYYKKKEPYKKMYSNNKRYNYPRTCPKHYVKLRLRKGKYGPFYGCPSMMDGKFCEYTEKIEQTINEDDDCVFPY